MPKYLYVGDMHATPAELDDCNKLIDYIGEVADSERVDRIVFLGDQYHTHDVVRLSVVNFWANSISRLSKRRLVFLVGNHDKPNDANATIDAMDIHSHADHVEIVSWARMIDGTIFAPYYHDRATFVETINQIVSGSIIKPKTLVCHQTFDGSKYENGFYCEDGVDAALINVDRIISGHIHSPQSFGRVWYPGAPRWRSISDANTERGIVVVTHAENGEILNSTLYPTDQVCRPIYEWADEEGSNDPGLMQEVEKTVAAGAKVFVSLSGTPEYVNTRKSAYKAAGAIVRCRFVGTTSAKVRESDGVDVAFTKYAGSIKTKYGSDPAAIIKNIQARMK
jgi:DNA repair exonuclease SbcCD nuclease subunit